MASGTYAAQEQCARGMQLLMNLTDPAVSCGIFFGKAARQLNFASLVTVSLVRKTWLDLRARVSQLEA